MSGLGLEELENRCLGIHAAEAMMLPRLADAVIAAAQLLERDLAPFERHGWRAVLRIRDEPRVVGLQIELPKTILGARLGAKHGGSGRVWLTTQLNGEDQYRAGIAELAPEADQIADAFRRTHRDSIQDAFVDLILHAGRLSTNS